MSLIDFGENKINKLLDNGNILYENKNVYIITINIKFIIDLYDETWLYGQHDETNRKIDEIKVNDIHDILKESEFQPLSFMTIATVDNLNIQIIDGQHRLMAYIKEYYNLIEDKEYNKELLVPIIFIRFENVNKMREHYLNINKCIPASSYYLDDDKHKKECSKFISMKFYKIFMDKFGEIE